MTSLFCIKLQEFKIGNVELLSLFLVVLHSKKNNGEIFKSAKGDSPHFYADIYSSHLIKNLPVAKKGIT